MTLLTFYKLVSEISGPFQVKQALQIGQMIQFVEPDTNNTREGTLMKMNPKYASIHCHDDNRYWQIPYYMLVVHARLVTVNTGYEAGTLNRNNIKVGENIVAIILCNHQLNYLV